ncbi:LytR/AlgR family response regulator transcription factor [Undibacterium sp. TC4M20W]|uniref:LytR/AlgR family response regulator transcription factor n=1 Tax=unclassified Undibacterium TaxID=2630295 RepID=UPI001331EAA0|nr:MULTISPECIES: LytTR family DNA-binding domain-containing protein [unclassified Undibacterium]BBB64041.1 DNA-binding response regulator [Undibacterium sp. KW1]BBB70018.1 DNA-binding response regulator [Undibacterium sp. YM2]
MTTAIIADDEDLPRKELRRMLNKVWPELEILAECEHGAEALEAIHQEEPDIAFLDIRMPGMTGLDVAHAVKGRCHAVFTTAYDSHALDAFAAGAVDYLLKPVSEIRLQEAVTRLKERIASKQPVADVSQLMSELDKRLKNTTAERIRWISASVGDTIKMFPVEKILFFSSDEKYTRVVCADDEAHVRKPLKEIMDGLDPDIFWQVHRGTVVRADAITRAHRDELGKYTVELRGLQEKLKVSQAYAWRFKPM